MSPINNSSLESNRDISESLDLAALLHIAYSLKKLLVAVVVVSLIIGAVVWFLLQSQFSAESVINLQPKEGQDEISVAVVMTEKSFIQDTSVIAAVIQSLGGAEAYLAKYRGDFDKSLDSKNLMLYALDHYRSNLTVYNYPNSSVLRVTIVGTDPVETADIVNIHIDKYIAQDLEFAQLEYERLHLALQSDAKKIFKSLALVRDELMAFATEHNVVGLQLNERDLVEYSSATNEGGQKLPPHVELKVDFLTREYQRNRNAYYKKKDEIVSHENSFSIRPLVALVTARATVGQDISPTLIFVLPVAVLIGLLVWFVVVVCVGIWTSIRWEKAG